MKSRTRAWIGGALTALVLTGCGTDTVIGAPETGSTAAASTERAPRIINKDGRPQVTFDPCLDLPDTVLIEAGYDPKTVDKSDFDAEYTFLGCNWQTPQTKYRLGLLSGNITFAEEQQKTAAYAVPIDINGRRALLEQKPGTSDVCAMTLETNYGILILGRNLFDDRIGPAPQSEWCAGLEDTARLFEPYLPKGK